MSKISYKITVPVNARPKEFLKSMAKLYKCEVSIDDEEHFKAGFLNLVQMVTIWFTIEGQHSRKCCDGIVKQFNSWKEDCWE